MQLTDRFFEFADHQLGSQVGSGVVRHIGLYVSPPPEQDGPQLLLVRQWSSSERTLPPADADPALRSPDEARRWYPLQEAGLILGAIRVDLEREFTWTPEREEQMRRSSAAVGHALSRDLECLQLEGELQRQNDQLRTLVHQLRNPLAALRTYAQLLMRRIEPDSAHQPLLSNMLEEQKQLGRYIDAIDNLGRQALLSTGLDATGPMLLPPAQLTSADTLANLIQPLAERAKATASLQGRQWIGPQSWPAWSERPGGDGSVKEIVANLLENAFRYSPSGCPIGMTLLDDGLCIWDQGPPIPTQEQERIFQRGERGSSSRNRPGTGLGLALARRLAERNGGSLTLCTRPRLLDPSLPEIGNAFHLTLGNEALPSAAG